MQSPQQRADRRSSDFRQKNLWFDLRFGTFGYLEKIVTTAELIKLLPEQ